MFLNPNSGASHWQPAGSSCALLPARRRTSAIDCGRSLLASYMAMSARRISSEASVTLGSRWDRPMLAPMLAMRPSRSKGSRLKAMTCAATLSAFAWQSGPFTRKANSSPPRRAGKDTISSQFSEASAKGADQLVACFMVVGVVDGLEAIKVNKGQGNVVRRIPVQQFIQFFEELQRGWQGLTENRHVPLSQPCAHWNPWRQAYDSAQGQLGKGSRAVRTP